MYNVYSNKNVCSDVYLNFSKRTLTPQLHELIFDSHKVVLDYVSYESKRAFVKRNFSNLINLQGQIRCFIRFDRSFDHSDNLKGMMIS